MAAAAALLVQCGCSTPGSGGMTVSGAKPLAEDARLRLGTVALSPDLKPAKFSFDKAEGQVGYASDWAGAAAGNVIGTSTSEPILDLPVGVGTLIAAPVVAIKGAIDARKHLTSEKLSECESNLVSAMSEMARQRHFHDWLIRAAHEQCKGRLITLEEPQNTGSGAVAPESVLEARVEELRLERTGSGDTSYRLLIRTRTRVLRTSDGAVLYDQPAECRSGECLFLDWTGRDGFKSVAETGYRLLAEQCVSRLLTTTDRPVLAGAGYRKSPAPSWNSAVRLAGSQPLSSCLYKRPVSYAVPDFGTLGIYSTGTIAHLEIQRPLTRDQATSEALDDVYHMFRDFIEHPNLCVVLPAAAIATPISLYKQGAAAVRGLSPRTLRGADAKLSEVVLEARPHEALAAMVAHQLAPQAARPVVLVRQPLPPGAEEDPELMHCAARGTLAVLTGGQTAGGYLLSQGADTALEIHVETARLAGKEGINPRLALCVEARATLLRSRDGWQLYSCPVQYRSKSRHFTAWAERDARLFRDELQRCYRIMSASIIKQLVDRGVVPPNARPQPLFARELGQRTGAMIGR